MNCLIVTDSGKSVGNGHISRCKILAQELNKYFNLTVVSEINYLKIQKGINFIKIKDLNLNSKIMKKINTHNYDLIIIDSYRKLNSILNFVKKLCSNIFIFDDYLLLSKHKYSIINQNPFFSSLNYTNKKNRHIFAGQNFTLINKNLLQIKPNFKKLKLFITCGMYDQKNLLPKIIDFLKKLSLIKSQNFSALIYINKNAKNLKLLKKKIHKHKFLKIHTDQKKYLNNLYKSNLCISPLGVSVWERMYVGIPTMTFPVNKHQLFVFRNLTKNNYVLPFLINNIKENLKLFRNEKLFEQKLSKISKKGKKLFSKNNKKKLAKRIADISKYYIQKR